VEVRDELDVRRTATQLKATLKQETEKWKSLFLITLGTASTGRTLPAFLSLLAVPGGRRGSRWMPKRLCDMK